MSTNSPIAQDKPRRLPSDAELMALPRDGYKRELLNGEIITSPAGFDHGRRIMRFSTVFAAFVYQHNLGEVFDGQTGFRMSNGDVLNPDISFVSRARMLQTGQRDEGFLRDPLILPLSFYRPATPPNDLKRNLPSTLKMGRGLHGSWTRAGGLYQPTTASSAPPCLKRPMSCPGKMLSTAFGSPLPQCLPGWSTAPEAA
jgi:hypothetical protein